MLLEILAVVVVAGLAFGGVLHVLMGECCNHKQDAINLLLIGLLVVSFAAQWHWHECVTEQVNVLRQHVDGLGGK